ncbi:hypothetical protein DY000_02031360 [Brassica cretica]|uniref:Uncharacterized protein n=1 Tax=Brassica cretica TaxID=69181 RepID=A0ABQ7DT41_BRACR|nr:hypothetical protein DY000_02031360 [Brassica cretica]
MESIQEQLNELSAYAYSKIGWHQSSIKDIQETLQNISNAIQKMDERWTRNAETTRSFIAAWSRILKEPNLTSNTKPDITACLGACYTWDQILQTSWKDLVATTIKACFIKISNKEFEWDLEAAIFKARFTKNSWI